MHRQVLLMAYCACACAREQPLRRVTEARVFLFCSSQYYFPLLSLESVKGLLGLSPRCDSIGSKNHCISITVIGHEFEVEGHRSVLAGLLKTKPVLWLHVHVHVGSLISTGYG